MMKASAATWIKHRLTAVCLLGALLLSGCAPATETPGGAAVPTAETSLAPTASPEEAPIAPSAGEAAAETVPVALYFRMREEGLLAREAREVRVAADDRLERVIIEELIDGPRAELLSLAGLFNPGTRLVAVSGSGSVLTVTLSSAFLDTPSDIARGWEGDAELRDEVLLRRRLALLSISAAITEATNYTAVQLLVCESDDDAVGSRVSRAALYADEMNPSVLLGPVSRSEDVLLTHYNTACVILDSWQKKDFGRLYRFVAQRDGERPTRDAFLEALSAIETALTGYSVTAGAVSGDGGSAVLLLYGNISDASGLRVLGSYPLKLVLEDGVWKIGYRALTRLMEGT